MTYAIPEKQQLTESDVSNTNKVKQQLHEQKLQFEKLKSDKEALESDYMHALEQLQKLQESSKQ